MATATKSIRKSTIAKEVAEILRLELRAYEIEQYSEEKFGFVTEKCDKQAEHLSNKAETRRRNLLKRLVQLGYCESEWGLTDEEANNDIFSEVAEGLHEIGDGNWC